MNWYRRGHRADELDVEQLIPVADMIEHENRDCVCGPLTVAFPTADRQVMVFVLHYSLDGRENRSGRDDRR